MASSSRHARRPHPALHPMEALPLDVTGQDPIRNFGTFFVGLVPARTRSKFQVGPGHYSLSTLSTVPYVTLSGAQGREKVFSWREVVRIPEGQSAWVANASWHDGDIVLNGGTDYSAVPARVTVPVPVQDTLEDTVRVLTPRYPCDTRGARSAHLAVNIRTSNALGDAIDWTIIGQIAERTGHSHQTDSENERPEYRQPFATPANVEVGLIPLGYAAGFEAPGLPMCLLDRASFTARFRPDAVQRITPNFYYVLEY